jgi:sec-independent protein translocase protein TatC
MKKHSIEFLQKIKKVKIVTQLEMPFIEHLRELRTRILRTLGVTFALACVFLFYGDQLFIFLTEPLHRDFPGAQIIGTGVAEAFTAKLKISIAAGMLASAPYAFYQIWAFIAPGLYENEKKYAIPFVVVTTLCFFLGVLFCYKVVLPTAFQYFSGEFLSVGIIPQIRIDEYLSFIVKLILVFGGMFEAPVLAAALAKMGVLRSQMFKKQGRIAIVVIFVVAGILTPPDIVSQLLLAGPMLVLYVICFFVVKWFEKEKVALSPVIQK